jgi:hypothetical protein
VGFHPVLRHPNCFHSDIFVRGTFWSIFYRLVQSIQDPSNVVDIRSHLGNRLASCTVIYYNNTLEHNNVRLPPVVVVHSCFAW